MAGETKILFIVLIGILVVAILFEDAADLAYTDCMNNTNMSHDTCMSVYK